VLALQTPPLQPALQKWNEGGLSSQHHALVEMSVLKSAVEYACVACSDQHTSHFWPAHLRVPSIGGTKWSSCSHGKPDIKCHVLQLQFLQQRSKLRQIRVTRLHGRVG
jgi:hypothetical protein